MMSDDRKDENNGENVEESFRLKICNLPRFLKYPQVKSFLDSNLKDMQWRKLRAVPGVAYFSLTTLEDAVKAMDLLHNKQFKGKSLEVKRVANEPEVQPKKPTEEKPLKTAAEITTPLAGTPYEQQVEIKLTESRRTANTLIRQLKNADVLGARYMKPEVIVKEVVCSPVTTHYRNKCEFTVGRDSDGRVAVGFVSGRMAEKEMVVVPPFDSNILTHNMYKIVQKFTDFVVQSGLDPFDEFKRTGFWKRITIRDFIGDCMLIFTAHVLEDKAKLKQIQDDLVKLFTNFGDVDKPLTSRVTSIYWQTLENASDPPVYEHLSGVPYIYESVLGVRFRISPATFFQTNSRGAEVLYNVIGDCAGLPALNDFSGEQDQFGMSPNKKTKTETENGKCDSVPTVLLDICCGAGTIGQCLLRRLERSGNSGRFICVGVELIEQAVMDARVNAIDNGFGEDRCKYLSGQAEVVFSALQRFLPEGVGLEESRLVGILDPPRAGISSKVIISCRRLKSMKTLIYVSCDPRAALKNIVDLCRTPSKKFDGEPFKLQLVQPVDMFPQTSHFEWVILLTRHS